MRYAEKNRKKVAVLVLTDSPNYYKNTIGFWGSGVLGPIAFAGFPLVTDPGSPRKKNRRNFDFPLPVWCNGAQRTVNPSRAQAHVRLAQHFAGLARYRSARPKGNLGNLRDTDLHKLRFCGPLDEVRLRRLQTMPARIAATGQFSFQLKIEHVFRASVRAVFTGCPAETNALIGPMAGEFSRQRSGSRSRAAKWLLRLRPGPYLKSLKALGLGSVQQVGGKQKDLRREGVSL